MSEWSTAQTFAQRFCLILLKEETAVCNLGSDELSRARDRKMGLMKRNSLATIATAMRMLDNVIDVNFYPIPETREKANMSHRAVGLGLHGFPRCAQHFRDTSYASHEAVQFADKSMEIISYYAILCFKHSLQKSGIPTPAIKDLSGNGVSCLSTRSTSLKKSEERTSRDGSLRQPWTGKKCKESIRKHGMRNSNT